STRSVPRAAVYVIRGVKDLEQAPAQVFQLDARSPAAFALADQFKVKPGDVVFVGAAGVTRWNRFASQLLPFSGLISNAASTSKELWPLLPDARTHPAGRAWPAACAQAMGICRKDGGPCPPCR